MERAEGLLGGKFLFKRQNDRTIDKTKVVCSICQAECSYHLDAKHPKESSPRLDDHQPILHDFSRKITRPVREKVTIWVASDCRPINIVEDSGLTEVIRIASGQFLRFTVGVHHCVSHSLHSLYDGERARKKYN